MSEPIEGPFAVRSNASWVMVTWGLPDLLLNRQTDTTASITFPQLHWRAVMKMQVPNLWAPNLDFQLVLTVEGSDKGNYNFAWCMGSQWWTDQWCRLTPPHSCIDSFSDSRNRIDLSGRARQSAGDTLKMLRNSIRQLHHIPMYH